MNEPILMNITGMDKPGITAAITQVLAQHNVNVLDIGQSVIHDALALGMLIQIPQDEDVEAVKAAIQQTISELNLAARFINVSQESYENWVAQQGKRRHIVTLLAKRVTAHQISRLARTVVENGLNIDKIIRLSGRVPLDEFGNGKSKACVEFSLSGPVADLPALRRQFLELSTEIDADIAYQENNVYRRNRRLIVFDMDSTLIQAEVIDELAKRAGVGKQVAEITERSMRGELDFKQSFTERVALLKGLPETALVEVAVTLVLTEGAEKLISTVKRLGYKTALISGGFTYFGRTLQKRLGIDYVFANELEIENGAITGRVSGEIVDGARKAYLLEKIAQTEGFSLEQTIAVGDGANDLPMLSIAGLGIAFRAKPIVKASAKQALNVLGLDGVLYLMGLAEREVR